MKRRLARALNGLLAPLGVRLVHASSAESGPPFDMRSALARLAGRGLAVRSVLDIGAASGSWSEDALRLFPEASFLAVEPLEERRVALEALRARHRSFDFALCAAGAADGGQATLDVADDLDGSTVEGAGGRPRLVPVRTVDALVAERGLRGPFLLKFDTHGYELPILEGARSTLAETAAIVMETYAFAITPRALRFPEMCAHLERLGFRCCDAAGLLLRPRDGALWQIDLVFARADAALFAVRDYR